MTARDTLNEIRDIMKEEASSQGFKFRTFVIERGVFVILRLRIYPDTGIGNSGSEFRIFTGYHDELAEECQTLARCQLQRDDVEARVRICHDHDKIDLDVITVDLDEEHQSLLTDFDYIAA